MEIIRSVSDLGGLWWSHRNCHLSSGTATLASLGSIVQKGKFSAGAADFVITLKKVDLLKLITICYLFRQFKIFEEKYIKACLLQIM